MGVGIVYTESCPSFIRSQEMFKWYCSCIRHLTCSSTGTSVRACEFRNSGRQCTGCYCWGRCKNKGRLRPSPTTARVLLGHFLHGADPSAVCQCASPSLVWLPISPSLREILSAGAGVGGAQGCAGGRRSPRGNRGGGEGSRGEYQEQWGRSGWQS